MISNPQLELAHKFVEFTHKNIFLTGKAGTGKTTFLHQLKKHSPKRCIVVAPTGVAAINAGGVTIHSFFQMPFGPHLPREAEEADTTATPAGYTRISKNKIDIIRSLDLLIIDEISMVRADLLDGIDEVLRRYRRTTKPFGGVQLLMIGDIRQLSPVVKDEDWQLLRPYYSTLYFYGSRALQKTDYVSIELKQIFRQSDRQFIDMLNGIRNKTMDAESLALLNQRYVPGFSSEEHEGYILLTTHNYKAKEINESRLAGIDAPDYSWEARVDGEFPEYIFPTEYALSLKKGAQVMFIKNDPSPEKQYYNGKIGVVEEIDAEDERIYVRCEGEEDSIEVERTRWENCKYTLNPGTKEIEEEVVGNFVQFPLKLAWAITIHKSQGLSFDKAIIDAQDSFAHGQVYVALSRCRTMEGLVLSTPIILSSIKTDASVSQFSREMEENEPDDRSLQQARHDFEHELILELFDFKTLNKSLLACMRALKEQRASLIIDQTPALQGMLDDFKTLILGVAEKFSLQLHQLFSSSGMIEGDTVLQDRIAKAAAYFQEKVDSVIRSRLAHISPETDNQQVNKQLKKHFGELHQDTYVKHACMASCTAGFEMKKYLEVRAKASLEKVSMGKSGVQEVAVSMENLAHPELFQRLKKWRNKEALVLDLPVYRIINQRALLGIASVLPDSPGALLKVKGIGKKKIERYGKTLIELITAYCAEKNIAYQPHTDLTLPEKAARPPRENTQKISFDLFREMKSIEAVAAKRGMVPRTIESHLAHFVEQGELEIDHFLTQAQLDEIVAAIRQEDTTLLSPLRESLKEKYGYSELKMAVAWYKGTTS